MGEIRQTDISIHYHNLTDIVADVADSRHAYVVRLHHADDVELHRILCKVAVWTTNPS